MFNTRRLSASCFLFLCLVSTGLAQGDQPGSVRQKISQTNSTVTASATADRVRFTAPNNVVRMQLQIISDSGQILFDVSSKGNVLDWSLQDSGGQRLQGSYLTVVTVKSLSGRLSERIGSVSIGEKQVELRRVDVSLLTVAQQLAVGPVDENATLTILQANEAEATTVLSNNGGEGQITRDRGALSFRLGDFFSGTDMEQMRLTEEGDLGIGTDKPQAKLDVAGAIRTTKGIEFADGTVQTSGQSGKLDSQGNVVPNAAGAGTQGRIAKWTDNSGTLGDSVVTEASGNIGIGTSNPQAALHVIGNQFLKPLGATPTYEVLAGSDPSTTVMLTTDGSGFGWQIAPTNAANDTIIQVLGQTFASVPNRGEFGIYLGADSNSAFKVIQRGGPERLRVNRNGNVGIGNNNPSSLLDVGGNINTSTQYNIGGSHSLSAPGLNNIFAGYGAGFSNTSGEENSFFGVSAGSSNQNGRYNSFVGAAAGFHNFAGNFNTAVGYSANFGFTDLTNATAIGAQAQVNQSNALVLGSINGVNSASANTNVGIGTTAPSATFHVVAYTNSSGENTATFQAPNIGSNQSHIHYGTTGDWYVRSAASAGKVVLQDSGGNVGIGTGSPDQTLTVNGGADKPGGGSWATFSDERLKTIKGRFTPGLKALMQLQPVRYEYKTDNVLGLKSRGQHIGFGAQTVQKIIPEAVSKNDQGYLLVNNDPILWTMLNAIKEQQQQLQQKGAHIEKLQARLTALEMMVKKLSVKQRPRHQSR